MRFVALALLTLLASLCSSAILAQGKGGAGKVIGLIDLTSQEEPYKITLTGQEGSLTIGKILVGTPVVSNASTQITILLAEGASASARPVDIRIGNIQSSSARSPRLYLSFRQGLKIGTLDIDRGSSAPSDPIVQIFMEPGVSVGDVQLNGGRYRSILLRPTKSKAGETSGTPTNITISRVSLADLSIFGARLDGPQPITLSLNAQLTPPLTGDSENNLAIHDVQLMGVTTIGLAPSGPKGDAMNVNADCTNAGASLLLELYRTIVGNSRGRTDEAGTATTLNMTFEPTTCLSLNLRDVDIYGDMTVKGSVLKELVVDNVDDHLGGKLTFEFTGVKSLFFGTATLNRVLLNTSDQGRVGDPVIAQWGHVQVDQSVSFPDTVYEALSTSLEDFPNDPTSAGIRNFLVDVRWKSFSSEKPEKRAAPKVLYAVLNSDAQEIFGPTMASFLRITTGFGQNLWNPFFCLCLLALAPLLIACAVSLYRYINKVRNPWIGPGPYYSALIAGDYTELRVTTPKLAYAVSLHRLIIAIEVGLVTLFIQNAILTGA